MKIIYMVVNRDDADAIVGLFEYATRAIQEGEKYENASVQSWEVNEEQEIP